MKILVKLGLASLILAQVACSPEEATADAKQGSANAEVQAPASASVKSGLVDLATVEAKVQAAFTAINPQYKVLSVKQSGIDGYYRAQLTGGPALYVNADATHFFSGDAFEISGSQMVNLSEKAMAEERLDLVKGLNPEEMIIFPAKGEQKAQITVYTDVDCFYCQKLHQEVPQLNEMGIAVRYMAFPRAGVGSPSYKKVVSAWCAGSKDAQRDAMDKLKARQNIPEKTCDNPVAAQYQLGQKMGVTGTPAIILDNGELIPGYRPADKLAATLGVAVQK